jgi:hypothetical protein
MEACTIEKTLVTAKLTAKPADDSKQSHILADNNTRKKAHGEVLSTYS